jgi:hypothetical protein
MSLPEGNNSNFGQECLKALVYLGKKTILTNDKPNFMQVTVDACFKIEHRVRAGLSDEQFQEWSSMALDYYFNKENDSQITVQQKTKSTCSNFEAVSGSSMTRNRVNDISALFGGVCSRHGVPQRHTFSDITKGEG